MVSKALCYGAVVLVMLGFSACRMTTYNEYYASGEVNGVKEGYWEIYFKKYKELYAYWVDPEVTLYAKGHFLQGFPEGSWTIYQDNGCKEMELTFSHGQLNGPFRMYEYHTCDNTFNDTFSAAGYYKNGVLDGLIEADYFSYPKGADFVHIKARAEQGQVTLLEGSKVLNQNDLNILTQKMLADLTNHIKKYVSIINNAEQYPKYTKQ